jgi:hypothetical protein
MRQGGSPYGLDRRHLLSGISTAHCAAAVTQQAISAIAKLPVHLLLLSNTMALLTIIVSCRQIVANALGVATDYLPLLMPSLMNAVLLVNAISLGLNQGIQLLYRGILCPAGGTRNAFCRRL